ncbi:hypothetical protein B5F71_11625 [Bacteroides sp. An269]|nr:hypothetical protein B5F71_11625 [Bacteroides sp. An269]
MNNLHADAVFANHIPVILLTSKTEFANRIEGLEQGADAYLGKPFSVEELHTLIGNLIANRIRLKGKYSGSSTQEGKRAPIVLQSSDEMLMDRIMKVISSAFKKMYGISPTEYKEANEE